MSQAAKFFVGPGTPRCAQCWHTMWTDWIDPPDRYAVKCFNANCPEHDKEYVFQAQQAEVQPRWAEDGTENPIAPLSPSADLDALLTKVLNSRVGVEQELFDIAAGKRPMPDQAKLRELAVRLGDPKARVAVGEGGA